MRPRFRRSSMEKLTPILAALARFLGFCERSKTRTESCIWCRSHTIGGFRTLYLPTTLTSDEYPNLLAPGETVDTLAASVLLVSFNWPEKSDRYRRMANFVDAFFSKFNEFHKPPRHPKWSEASLNIKDSGMAAF